MTELLEHALQKATLSLNETEQDLLAKFLLQNNLHNFIKNSVIGKYNLDTQQAIRNTAERKNLNHYNSTDEFFTQFESKHQQNPAKALLESDFIGCGKADAMLSVNYKQEFAKILDEKYDHN